MEIWLNNAQLRQLLNCSKQAILKVAKSSFEGKMWRGCLVQVQKVKGATGQGGTSYEFLLSSLPEDVQAQYHAETGTVKTVKEVKEVKEVKVITPVEKSAATQIQLIQRSRQRVKKNQVEQVLKKMNTLTPTKLGSRALGSV